MNYKISHEIQDGKLYSDEGRIVIHKGVGVYSRGPARDHTDLSRELARKYGMQASDVGNNGYRFYWRPIGKTAVMVCPSRRIDEDWMYNHIEQFNHIIDDLFDHK